METRAFILKPGFDKINAAVGAFVLIFTFIIFRMTVAPTISFWDCGEFLACSYILGIPHPPGSMVFVVVGRFFSALPIAADICFRINLISVICSALTTLLSYFILVRIIKYWYEGTDWTGWKRAITYIGAATGAFFLAFSATNWGNSVEAEVYSLSMLIMSVIYLMMLKFYDNRGTALSERIIMLVVFLAMLGVVNHLTTYLVVPVAAIYFIMKKDVPRNIWWALNGFFWVELLAIFLISSATESPSGYAMFIALSLLILVALAIYAYKYINWPVLIALGAMSMIMIGFYEFFYGIFAGLALIIMFAFFAKQTDWKSGLVALMIAVIGFSFFLVVPVRSTSDPHIDENNTKRSFSTFVDFVDRKQYGRESMVERMFHRRGTWAHQFGRHANMGFWSFFEQQYLRKQGFPGAAGYRPAGCLFRNKEKNGDRTAVSHFPDPRIGGAGFIYEFRRRDQI